MASPWPPTRTVDASDTLHGVVVRDPYRWLEDERADDVQAWMNAQDAHARAELAKSPARAELAARLAQVFYYDATSAPAHHRGRYFYTRKHADKEKTIAYWRQGEHGEERVLLDPNTWSDDGSKSLHGWWPSHDGTLVAYAVSEHNSDETVMHVLDVARGEDLPDVIEGTKYAAASWVPDGSGFYYTWVPPVGGDVTPAARPGFAEIRFHALGGDPARDRVVHEATRDAHVFLGGYLSYDGRWLFAVIQHGWNASDVYFKDTADLAAPWTTLVAGVDANFSVHPWRDRFYIHTNDGAPRYRVLLADPARPERAAWQELVPEREATLEGASVVGEHLVLSYLRDATSQVEVRTLAGALAYELPLPPLGTADGLSGHSDEDTAYVAYSSFTTPQVIYKVAVGSGVVEEYSRLELPVDTSRLVTEQVFVTSKDGTKLPMFLVHRDDVTPDRVHPTILYGYGGFNVAMTPQFSGARALWLERGGVYAIANLRGGSEYGEDWHRAGMLLAKQNVFDDFIACAEHLIAAGWTSPEHLAISGGSNGGLLVGAVMAQRPELFRAVSCAVPLLDMVRYHLSGSGATWVPEYGSADDAEQFRVLWEYSPYRRVIDAGPHAYPAVLFDSSDHDDRVDPLHARKLAAAVQAMQTADRPVLLRIERNAGHGGADMVRQQVERVADQLAFLLHQLE